MRIAMLLLNEISADPRVTREASALADAGHEVTVFCPRQSARARKEDTLGFAVHRVGTYATAPIWQMHRKISQHRERNAELARAVVDWRPDVVHCHDSNTIPAGRAALKSIDAGFVFDAHELYAESLQQQKFQRTWPVQRYWQHAEAIACKDADEVIVVSDRFVDVFQERYDRTPTVVENVPDLMPVGDRTLLRTSLGISEARPIVLYQGGLFVGRALNELVDAVADLDCELVLQGRGPGEEWVRERAVMRGIEQRVHLMGWVEPERIFELTCGADIGTCFLDGITLNHQLTWPNRVFMYFMAGIPSAVSELPGIGGLVRSCRAGVTAEPGSVSSMRDALERLLSDPDLCATLGGNARVAAESRFNWTLAADRLIQVYQRLG